MNKLITTNNGGYPFVLDDLRFVDDSVRETFKNTFRMYGGTSGTGSDGFLLTADYYQNQILPGGTTIPQMGVFMNGEIFTLNSFTLPVAPSGSNNFINIVIETGYTNFAPGLKVLQNGVSLNTYETRIANRINTNSGGGGGYAGQFQAFQWVSAGASSGWKILNNANFTYLQNQKSGLNSAFINIGTNTTNIATNTNDISAHESRLDAIDAPWNTITGTALKSALGWEFQNGTFSSPIAYSAPVGTFDSSSFVKWKIIGSTMFVNFNVHSLIVPKCDQVITGGIATGFANPNSIIVKITFQFDGLLALGRPLNNQISGTVNVGERNLASPASNVAYIEKLFAYLIGFRMNNFGEESGIGWNYSYTLTTGLAGTINRKGNGTPEFTVNPSYSLRGSFQIELD